jgi:predicted PurR-regulated permease PerM
MMMQATGLADVTEMTKRRVVVQFDARSILVAAGVLLGLAATVKFLLLAQAGLILIAIALFLAVALNPAVEFVERRGLGRAWSVAAVYSLALALSVGLGLVFVPPLVEQVTRLVDGLPDLVADLTRGQGPLGFLETKYHVVERVQQAVKGNGAGRLTGGATAALDVTRSVITFVAGLVTILFMTFFMLLEGPAWRDRFIALLPQRAQPRAHGMAQEIAHTIGGYVTGNLLISVIAGFFTTIVLLAVGVPFALALGLLVAILDLIPLAGATLGAIIVTLVALTHSLSSALIVLAFFVVYQQLENHLLQPIVYGRTVKLSPLAILVSVLVGAEVAGVIGALGAIPVAGTIQIIISDWLQHRRPPPPENDLTTDSGLELPAGATAANAP